MTEDKNDQTPEHSDDFEEEFDFDDINIEEDVLAEEPQSHAEEEAETPAPERKTSALPLLIGLTVVGFIGWKVYGMLTGPKKTEEAPNQAAVEKDQQTTPEVAAQAQEIPTADLTALENKVATAKANQAQPTTSPKGPEAKPSPGSTLLPSTQGQAQQQTAQAQQQPTQEPSQTTATLTPNAAASSAPVATNVLGASAPAQQPPSTSLANAAPTTAPTAQPEAPVMPSSPAPTTTASLPVAPTAPVIAAANAEAKEAFEKLEKELNEQEQLHKEHFAALERNLTLTAQNSANTNKSVAALEHEVTALTNVIHDLTQEIKMIREEQAKLRTQQSAKIAAPTKMKPIVRAEPNPTLSIHAIIPGRAWLRAQDGKMLTVAEGDAIGEYGKVLKIDAANGVVVTTSGVTLR